MEKKYFAPSELIINEDGSAFHLHMKPDQLAEKVILVGDPGRVETVASFFESREAEVPKAMAEAFRSGNLGIMDYYKMKNIQADTDMRASIAQPETGVGNTEIK